MKQPLEVTKYGVSLPCRFSAPKSSLGQEREHIVILFYRNNPHYLTCRNFVKIRIVRHYLYGKTGLANFIADETMNYSLWWTAWMNDDETKMKRYSLGAGVRLLEVS
jgi:hypothetical protein